MSKRRHHRGKKTTVNYSYWMAIATLLCLLTRITIMSPEAGIDSEPTETQQTPLLLPQFQSLNQSNRQPLKPQGSIARIGKAKVQKQSRRCLIFYHVPKCGGMTTKRYLHLIANQLHWKVEPWYGFPANRKNFPPKNSSQRRWRRHDSSLTKSVIHVGLLTPYFERMLALSSSSVQSCYRMTVLREPVDRVVSAFYFHDHSTEEWQACLNKSCSHWHQYHDDMVRHFGNPRSIAWTSFDETNYAYDIPTTTNNASTARAGTEENTFLQDAKTTLSRFDFVCVLSHLRPCLQAVATAFKVRLHPHHQQRPEILQENQGHNRPQRVNQSILEQIAQANALDRALYDWVWDKYVKGKYDDNDNNDSSTWDNSSSDSKCSFHGLDYHWWQWW